MRPDFMVFRLWAGRWIMKFVVIGVVLCGSIAGDDDDDPVVVVGVICPL